MKAEVPQSFIDFVNRCKDGHPVIASMDDDRVPHVYETKYQWTDGNSFTITECAFAEATHADYMACPWPEKGGADPNEGWHYYWISYD